MSLIPDLENMILEFAAMRNRFRLEKDLIESMIEKLVLFNGSKNLQGLRLDCIFLENIFQDIFLTDEEAELFDENVCGFTDKVLCVFDDCVNHIMVNRKPRSQNRIFLKVYSILKSMDYLIIERLYDGIERQLLSRSHAHLL